MAGKCTICGHPQRKEIDRALVGGESDRSIASRLGLSRGAVLRHAKAHVRPAKVAPPTAATAARMARAAEAQAEVVEAVVEQDRATLDLFAELRVRTMGYLDQAEKALPIVDKMGNVLGEKVDWPAVSALLREIRGCLESQAKLRGELQSGTQVNVLVQAERAEFVRVVIGALADEPAALAKVAAAVERAAADGGGR